MTWEVEHTKTVIVIRITVQIKGQKGSATEEYSRKR